MKYEKKKKKRCHIRIEFILQWVSNSIISMIINTTPFDDVVLCVVQVNIRMFFFFHTGEKKTKRSC